MPIVDEKSFKILIASENQTFRNNLAGKLRIDGFSVEFANSGFHLLHVIEKEIFHLILLNENMYDMSAFEITSLIRSTKSKQELPVIFISKDKNQENIKDMILIGANEYIMHSPSFAPISDKAKKYFAIQQST